MLKVFVYTSQLYEVADNSDNVVKHNWSSSP